jgi:acetyltransferase-like isoleucine patch superfamily enzyme
LYEENGLKEEVLTENKGIIEIGIITSERLEVELLSFAVVKLSTGSSIPMQMRKFHNIAPDGYLEISKYEFRSINDSVNNYIGRLLTPESHYLSETLLQNKDLLSGYQGDKTIRIGKCVSVGKNVKIGKNSLIEDFSTISDNCTIGERCKIHRNVFIDEGVKIGNLVKIQNNNSIYHGVVIEDGAFVGTNVSFTNDIWPRSINKDGTPVTTGDWELKETHVCKGASIGAGAVIKCGITIGEWAMIGCGAVVTHDVPAYAVVYGPYADVHRMCEN